MWQSSQYRLGVCSGDLTGYWSGRTVADVVALMGRDVAATRVGHAGVAQVATLGLIATAYDHYDSYAATS